MKREKISYAIGDIDSKYVEEAASFKEENSIDYSKGKWQKWALFFAACLVLLVGIIPFASYFLNAYTHTNTPTISAKYNSINEAHLALGYETLYSQLPFDKIRPNEISIVYNSASVNGNLEIDFSKPRELSIHTTQSTDKIDYHIIFNKEKAEDDIYGFSGEKFAADINGITVYYSFSFENDVIREQAKFIYEGDLYAVNIETPREQSSTSNGVEYQELLRVYVCILDLLSGLNNEVNK